MKRKLITIRGYVTQVDRPQDGSPAKVTITTELGGVLVLDHWGPLEEIMPPAELDIQISVTGR